MRRPVELVVLNERNDATDERRSSPRADVRASSDEALARRRDLMSHLAGNQRGALALVVACAIIGAVIVGDPSRSVLDWLVFIAAAAFFTGVGLSFLLQVNSTVSVGPHGLAFRTSGGLRVVTIPWDDIDAIGWRPPPRWIGGSGEFFVETRDGRRLSNPVIKDPTPEFAQTLYSACQRHHINDVVLRTKLPKIRSSGTLR